MDNLTHSLTGVFLSRAGLNRISPEAVWLLLVSANAPDCDTLAWVGGSANFLHWHRNFTHALLFAPILSLLTVLLVRLFTRTSGQWLAAFGIALIGVLSHLLLDLTNNYGVRLWLPISDAWLHWDTTYVVDFWIWAILLVCLFAPWLSRLITSEMQSKRRRYPGRAGPILALSLVLAYDGARFILHARALAVLNSRLYGNEPPVQVAAFPSPVNPLVWNGIAETASRAYLYSDLALNDEFNPDATRFFFRGSPGSQLALLRSDPEFKVLIEFSQFPLWRLTSDSHGTRYALTDLRFGDPVAETFTCSARFAQPAKLDAERCDFTFSSPFNR